MIQLLYSTVKTKDTADRLEEDSTFRGKRVSILAARAYVLCSSVRAHSS